MNLTEKEKALLHDIVKSEYQDGNPVGHSIWLDYVVDSKSKGGVLTSLQRKGFVEINLVPLADSDNRAAGISDSTIELLPAGYAAYLAAKSPSPTP